MNNCVLLIRSVSLCNSGMFGAGIRNPGEFSYQVVAVTHRTEESFGWMGGWMDEFITTYLQKKCEETYSKSIDI